MTAVAILASVGGTVACAAPTRSAGTDCTSQLRFHGATYTAYRLTRLHEKKAGRATPTCQGRAVDEGHLVAVWSLPGQPPTSALARQSAQGHFAVYVADSLSPEERGQVLRTLGDGR